MCAQSSFALSQITRLRERQTDGQTAFSWPDHDACNTCNAVKNY